MSYHQDWLMRQIEAISAMLAYMLTGKRSEKIVIEEERPSLSDGNPLYRSLHLLIQAGQICEAENLLFSAMEDSDPDVPEAAVQFYAELNQLSDEMLEAHNFSREEIMDGLKAVCSHYGLNIF